MVHRPQAIDDSVSQTAAVLGIDVTKFAVGRTKMPTWEAPSGGSEAPLALPWAFSASQREVTSLAMPVSPKWRSVVVERPP